MANIKSQKKRIRTNEAARMRNKAVKSELKTLTKHVQSAVAEGDAEKAVNAYNTLKDWGMQLSLGSARLSLPATALRLTPRLSMLAVCSTRLLPRASSTRTRLPTASLVLPSS